MLQTGTRIGPYEIVDALGSGGMGEVYKARDTRLGRLVALKVIRSDRIRDADRRTRLLQEARAASSLNHQNIVGLHDIVTDPVGDVLVLEYVDGRTLDESIRKGIHLNDALRWAIQIADALAAAHRAGIVHRDLKPANIMITDTGTAKVLDFGLAKFSERGISSADEQTQTLALSEKTEDGLVVGTAAYMSPEQAQARPVDARTDIFSFGAVLYEMLTGHKAFPGNSTVSTLSAIVRDDPKPAVELRTDMPPDLQKVINRCLRKDVNRRFQTTADLKVALEEIQEESASGITPVTTPKPRRNPYLFVGLLLSVLLAAVVLWLWSRRQGPILRHSLEAKPITAETGEETDPDFSPDGTQIVFVATDILGKDADLFILDPGTGAKLQLTSGPAVDHLPRWSPDGKWIAFRRTGEGLFLISPLGGPVRRISPHDDVYELAWMPDSKTLLVTRLSDQRRAPGRSLDFPGHSLGFLNIEAGGWTELTDQPDLSLPAVGRTRTSFASLALSPDGRLLARVEGGGEPVNISIYGLEGTSLTRQRTIPISDVFVSGVAFLGDNEHLIASMGPNFNSMRLVRVAVNGGPMETLPLNVQHTLQPVVSRRGGKLIFTRWTEDENLYRLRLTRPGVAGGQPVAFATSTGRDSNPNISPDGKQVAFASYRSGGPEIYICDATTGAGVQRLTNLNAMIAGSPRFSPDSKWIVFDSRPPSAQADIYIMAAEGGPARRITNHAASDTVPTWSRDGQHIYFHSDRGGSSQIWKMKADGSDPVQITKQGGYIAFEAADRLRIFYSKGNGALTELWSAGANGGNEHRVVDTLYRHNFSPVKSGVYLSTGRGLQGGPEILYYSFADGTTRTVHRLDRPVALGLTVAADENWLLFSQADSAGSDLMMVDNFQ